MGRLMPGWVRQEGIQLYQDGRIQFQKEEAGLLVFEVDQEHFEYASKDERLACTCSTFTQKSYCSHLAAVEYFLKNDPLGRELAESFQQADEIRQKEERATEGSIFLDRLLGSQEKDTSVSYQLKVEGVLSPYDQNIDWEFWISRSPGGRTYIIRDMAAFLQIVRRGACYQLGKNYYEPLKIAKFDPASQDLIHFLWTCLPEKTRADSSILTQFGRVVRLPLYSFEEGVRLLSALADFQFIVGKKSYTSLPLFPLEAKDGLFSFRVKVHTHHMTLTMEEADGHSLFKNRFFFFRGVIYQLDAAQQFLLQEWEQMEKNEQGKRVLEVHFHDRHKLAQTLAKLAVLGQVEAPEALRMYDFTALYMFDLVPEKGLTLELRLDFSGTQVISQTMLDHLPFTCHYLHLQEVRHLIADAGFEGFFTAYQSGKTDLYHFFTQLLPLFQKSGQVTLSPRLAAQYSDQRPEILIDRQSHFLEVTFQFQDIAEEEIQEAMQALLNHETYYQTQDGRIHLFDEETQRISASLVALRATKQEHARLQLSPFTSYQLSQVTEESPLIHWSEDFREMAYHLSHPEAYPLKEGGVRARLRQYQRIGVQWLSMLDHYGFGGILADDMGLGKTLQTIAFLAATLENKDQVLILAPSSLIYNWQEEWQKFAPHIQTSVVYGTKEERLRQLDCASQVIITSYTSFRQDRAQYKMKTIDYLILDEAQAMKNAQTKLARYLREFEAKRCFALSGTPIENRLTEIWSIFQIVLPGLLPSKKDFLQLSPQEVSRLIRPFVLRRKKEEVLMELPDLIEVTIQNDLLPNQKSLYLAQLRQMQETVSKATDAEISRNKLQILSGITRLRQICDTPRLFLEDYTADSGKMETLRQLLIQLKEGNHRVLIFSQFRSMLDLIGKEVEALGLDHYLLTGSTPAKERQEMTIAFNAGSRDAFLISLKAGGIGLNLTGADTVILVDLWWNPAVEEQAVSRAYRMGQQRTVEVYRLVTRGTIEEKMLELQERKKHLVTAVLDGNESRASLTAEDIREILGIEENLEKEAKFSPNSGNML
ncbi:DEAD/DEAH box helicase [Streptococcus sp. DD13]|uniref:DEAD/DEAH box helicase n=1 Tax=Streptococcus sp. DD13 TaxID=1777881 RepID=UPI000795615E|nr:DEAD/DEAH box helicase [Streptococcus sp. DD13]KXT78202.1 SWF/SNF family helicase [Streptococcus sp. DD13]